MEDFGQSAAAEELLQLPKTALEQRFDMALSRLSLFSFFFEPAARTD